MARIKKFAPEQNLSSFQTFVVDSNPNSDYFRITEFKDTFTGGKNGFLIEGSEYLKESTEIKIDILDVNGDPIYYEPGNGIPEYYEGISKLIAVYIYEDTPIGLGKITVLGELKEYDDNGVTRPIPDSWKGAYNVKWERTFQVNKNLANEDRVRFYRRPKVSIDEINKPIFNNNSLLLIKSGSANGVPLVPTTNTNLSNFSLPTSYRIITSDDNFWTGSVEGQTITFGDINYSATIDEVISDTEIVVSPPYTQNNLVKPFTNEDYSVSFNYLEGVTDLATALTGSFAKINITDMKTFVGDAARVKVFRRSQSNLTDYEFVQEIQLESNELLRDIETVTANEENYGNFTEDILSQYWVTSSNDFTAEFNRTFLYNSAKLSSTESNYFITSQSFNVQSGVEYTLDFNVRKETANSTHFLKAFLSGSLNGTAKSQTIVTIPSSNGILQKQNFNENILADEFDSAQLYFEVSGSDWYINNVSLKASQETSFSPDEITFIQQVPKTLQTETFDYRFEFYDINNNYIPVLVEETKTFDGGNLNLFNKSITITPNQLYFTFDSASNPSNPLPPYTIVFDIETSVVTGSVNFTSGAYDEFGDYISASEYIGGQYPGLLKDRETGTPTLHVSDFTGSRDDIFVQYIRFTGEVEGVSDSVVISRVQDGKGGVNFEIRPYRGTIIKNKSDKDLEVQAIRIDGINEIVLRDNLPQVGFSDAKLRILTSSVDPITSNISSSYLLLSEATAWGVIQGVTAGTTGSGEIDYNAVFNRDAIDSELTLYLMDGHTSESILTSLILTDLQDGLDSGFISFDAEQFGIKPRTEREFTPNISRVTGSFYLRGTNENPISGTLDIFPSMSVDPETIEPTYYMFYVTNSFDRRISIEVTDFDNNIINSGIPGQSGITFYEAVPTKQLNTKFTYTEDITSSSISVDKTFSSVPDGLPGIDSIAVIIDPNPIVLNADQRGRVFNYENANTDVIVNQGNIPLIFTGSKKPGTFTTASIITTGIDYSIFDEVGGDASMSLSGFDNMNDLTASIEYVLEIHPFFTASFFTQSYFQQIKKSLDGAAAINIELEPTVVSIVTEENGGAYNYSSANTTLKVKQGDEYLEYNSLEIPGTFTASFATSNISVGLVTSSKTEITENGLHDTLNFVSMSNMNADSASIDYNITVRPFSITNGIVTGSQSIVRKQLFTKNKEGVKARSVSLETTSQTVNFDGDGVVTSPIGSIFLTATAFNVTGSQTYYQFFQDGYAYSTIGTDNTFEIGSGDATSPGQIATWKVEIRDGANDSPVVASSEVTITGIKSGANNYQVFLTNPSPTVGVEVDGTTDFTKTGTQIKAFKGTQELAHVTTYSSPTLDLVGDPIGVLGEFSASVWVTDTYITQPNYPVGNPATVGPITAWTLPQDNPSATIVYKVDIEDGRATYFLSQSISTVFEGATGPGVVFRGPWTGSIEYIYDKDAKRRDAVLWSENGSEPYDTYYATKDSGSSYIVPSGSGYEPTIGGVLNDTYWISLGQEEFFVAAKIAIFEESFVKNTINVGTPPSGNPNANIAIVGGTDEPYIAIGQTGTQGYAQPGIWFGMSNDGGPSGTSGTMGLMSLKSTPDGGTYNSLEWDGETLTIRGAIRQTSAGVIEPSLRGNWTDATEYYPQDLVQYLGETWSSNTSHTSNAAGGASDGPPGTGPWTIAAGAGKTVNLSADSFIIQYDTAGSNPTPSSTITLIASSSNFQNAYFKFTGGGAAFTDETSFTDGLTANTDTATFSVPSSYFSTPLTFNVSVSEGDQTEKVSDSITITALKSGADVSPQYMITPIVGGTQIKNSSGTIELQVQQSDSTGLSDVTSGTNARIYDGGTLLAAQTGVTDGGNGVEYNPIIASSFINGSKVLTLKDASSNVLDTITLVDVTDGLGGGSFLSPNLKTTRTPGIAIYSPTFLSATASFFDTSGTEYTKQVKITPSYSAVYDLDYMAVGAASGDSEITITANDGDGGSITLGGSPVATKDVVLIAEFTDPATSQTTTITETFYVVSNGADGLSAITVVNTNQSHTVPADVDGVVSSYSNSGTTITLYEGTASLDYDGVGTSAGTWKVASTTISPTGGITRGNLTDSGVNLVVADHSAMDNGESVVTITYNITGTRKNGDAFPSVGSIPTTQTITKAIAGVNGTSGTSGVSGTNGAPGTPSGVVYAGEWDLTGASTTNKVSYLAEEELKYVTKYSGNYYVCATTHRYTGTFSMSPDYYIDDVVLYSGTYYICIQNAPSGNGYPNVETSYWTSLGSSIAPSAWSGGWAAFGAEFVSVATDILFAQDVYANKTINIGTGTSGNPVIALNADAAHDYENPFISIGQTSQLYEADGIFLGFSESTASLSIMGDSARANIGGWEVDKRGIFYATSSVIGTSEQTSTTLVADRPIFISEITSSGKLDFNGSSTYIQSRTSDYQVTVSPAVYAFSSSLSDLQYVSHSFTSPDHWNTSWSPPTTPFTYQFEWVVANTYGPVFVIKSTNGLKDLFATDTEYDEFVAYMTSDAVTGDGKYPIIYFRDNGTADLGIGTWATQGYNVIELGQNIHPSLKDTFLLDSNGESLLSYVNGLGGDEFSTAQYISDVRLHIPWYVGKNYDDTTAYNNATSLNAKVYAGYLSDISASIETARLHASGSINNPSGYQQTNNKPFLSLGQVTQSFDTQGIYLGYISGSDNAHLSLKSGLNSMLWDGSSLIINGRIEGGGLFGAGAMVEGSGIYVPSQTAPSFSVDTYGNLTAESATIRGTIQATDGNIGDWVIDSDTQALRDDNSEIIFDPNTPEIGLYTNQSKTVRLSPSGGLANTDATSVTIPGVSTSWSTTPGSANSAIDPGTTVWGTYGYTGLSSVFNVAPGTYPISFALGSITLASTGMNTVNYTVTYPSYNGTYDGQMHGYYSATAGYRYYQLYGEILYEDPYDLMYYTETSVLLVSVIANSAYEYNDFYIWENAPVSVTGDTPITLYDGSTKLAEDITPDDKLLVWDETNNKMVASNPGAIMQRLVDKYFVVTTESESVKVSDTHAFYLDGNFEKPVQELIVGEDEIYVYKNGTLTKELVISVDEVNATNNDVYVYTFRIPTYENYISANILSHNPALGTWVEDSYHTTIAATNGTFSSSTVVKNFTLSKSTSIDYKFRYKARVGARSGQYYNIDGYNNQSAIQYQSQTTSISNVTIGGLDSSLAIDVPSNITEITGKGVQVLSGANQFVRIERFDSGTNNTILQTAGGNILFGQSTDSSTTGTYKIKAGKDSWYDIGENLTRFRKLYVDDVYASTLNDLDISSIARVHAAGPGTTTNDTNSVATNYDSYVKLPGGTIIQWGHIYDTSDPKYVAFPTQFPNAVHSVVCSTNRSSNGSGGYNHVYNYDRNGVDLILDGSYGFWIAIGY